MGLVNDYRNDIERAKYNSVFGLRFPLTGCTVHRSGVSDWITTPLRGS